MDSYTEVKARLMESPKTWAISGVAGFIGSNLLETLLELNQVVVGLDNFATGHRHNFDDVKGGVTPQQWQNFTFIEGDICNLDDCRRVVEGADYVLHQAALGSVPRSLNDPITTNRANIDGFLNMLVAARDVEVSSFTYAASSSTYGDHPALPKQEDNIGRPLSPYAVTKYVNELYADVFSRSYGFQCVGLRYFNVFGKRQDPNGAYAAVIPKWVGALLKGEVIGINGDGETSRDFCYIKNAVQANILAAVAGDDAKNEIYNVAVGDRTTLNELFGLIRENIAVHAQSNTCLADIKEPVYNDFRPGDVRHSQADISKASKLLGYQPSHNVEQGLVESLAWYVANV